jgi:hypothetical protein
MVSQSSRCILVVVVNFLAVVEREELFELGPLIIPQTHQVKFAKKSQY